MSRLTDLITRAKSRDLQLGIDLEREFRALSSRLPFGLNFERHHPEAVELPQRPVRRGDKVRVLPPRGSTSKADQRVWAVKNIVGSGDQKQATLELLEDPEERNAAAVEDLVVVAEFGDTIYPGLMSTGRVERGGRRPWHTVINGENYHALKALTWTHRGKVDAIYIDPPYNTGARDWKYNNDYVEGDDLYRHSKWLAMMERRLLVAKKLLNERSSVLIVTIDEKEYLRLGLLLEQTFPEARIQMISSVINPKGTARTTELSRTDEYIYVVFLGEVSVPDVSDGDDAREVRWRYLRRTDVESRRGTTKGGPAQFYPIYVSTKTHQIVHIGKPLPHDVDRTKVENRKGAVAVFPIREEDGMEMNWGLVGPSLQKALDSGFVRVSKQDSALQPYVFSYLTGPNIKKIETGQLTKAGRRSDGSWIVISPKGRTSRPTTNWREQSHDAGAYGTSMLRRLLPGRKFPFPKALYAVEDVLRLFVASKPSAVILDFFAGSGTTAHAVMRLNKQDGGQRQCISVTNNEVAANEHKQLRNDGLRPGDADWERLGICDHITKPRVEAAISGKTPDGEPIKGDYRFADTFPMAVGFEQNAEFFTLTYETLIAVNYQTAYARIAPLLWLRAGSEGSRIDKLPRNGWAVADRYGLLVDLDAAADFLKAVRKSEGLRVAYIVTDDERRFQAVARRLADGVEPVRLYESYLTNFAFANGDTL